MPDRALVTVTESVVVNRPPDEVFDFTQDYTYRSEWDRYVRDPEILSEEPRRIRVRVPMLGSYTIEYQLFRRGERTSAAFVDVASWLIAGGGGSWRYEPDGVGTRWTQTNTMELKHPRLFGWMVPMLRRNLQQSMRTAMAKASRMMEHRAATANG